MTRRIEKPDTYADIELRQCLDDKKCFVMIAGAGSGKTTSLVKALDYLRKTQGELLRKRNQRIACITYTTVAEYEIWSDVGHDPLFHVSTIHSFLWDVVKPFQTEIKSWVVQRITEKLNKLEEQRNSFGSRHHQSTKDKNQKDTVRYQELLNKIATISHFRYETGSSYPEGILGHDDIIKMAPNLIKERPLLKTIFAQKYPFLFIDESQDTIVEVVEAAKSIAYHSGTAFCLGFFGDEMQKIYPIGTGKIAQEEGWIKITKQENFRCSNRVRNLINNIRRPIDGLEQKEGAKGSIEGSANLFLFHSNVCRDTALLMTRQHIAKMNNDPQWLSDEKDADVKLLVIEHRMAANRLKFPDLYSAFKDDAPKSFSNDFTDGKVWALRPFQNYLLPLVTAFKLEKSFNVLELLRQHCPVLKKDNLQNAKSPTEILESVKTSIQKLSELMSENSVVKVREVLKFASDNGLIKLDDRILERLHGSTPITLSEPEEDEEESIRLEKSMTAYFECPVVQLWGYQTYVNDETPFATQHGIKGSDIKRVLVVLDDEEGKRSTLYSYDKLFGVKDPSDTDKKNLAEKKDSVFERTRRLLYVSCSRAMQDLAVVFFVSDVDLAEKQLRSADIFSSDAIIKLSLTQ